MTLDTLINYLKVRRVCGNTAGVVVNDITNDSREVKAGSLFIATRGSSQDGHEFIAKALDRKAVAIVLNDEVFVSTGASSTPLVVVEDAKEALSAVAACFFGNPQERVHPVGITGTNGKTTTSYLIRSIVRASGQKCGVVGTIGYQVEDENIPFPNTTPGVIMLYRILKKMADAGLAWAAIEVSSHALDQGRVGGLLFPAVVFTNLTQDHLDYHKTMGVYFEAKQKLFREYVGKDSVAIVNADDIYGQQLIKTHRAGKMFGYGFGPLADIQGKDALLRRDSSSLTIATPQGSFQVITSLVGRHNLYNILAAAAFGISQGFDFSVVQRGIETMTHVPGRLERVDSPKGFSVFIDYAHTDDALKNVLESLRQIPHNGSIITVFGCGGDRDRGKRPKMGRVVTDLSDYGIITSDNSRNEDPQVIVGDIVAGVINSNYEIELDRRLAIKKALAMAKAGDFVLVAGKGHEITQTIKDQVLPFDDKKIVLELIRNQGHV